MTHEKQNTALASHPLVGLHKPLPSGWRVGGGGSTEAHLNVRHAVLVLVHGQVGLRHCGNPEHHLLTVLSMYY